MSRLRQIAEAMWVAEQPLRFAGLEMGTRMTVVRLADGSLWVHSPIRRDDALDAELATLGEVAHVVAPNRFHHLFAAEFAAAWPKARLYAAPGLAAKNPDLASAAVLPEAAPDAWRSDLDWVAFRGLPLTNEVVFLHRPSRTLVQSDLAFHIGAESPRFTRIGFRLMGRVGALAPTLLERVAIRDRAAARASLEQILAWDFERVIVAHGSIVESGGREALRSGFGWLLDQEAKS